MNFLEIKSHSQFERKSIKLLLMSQNSQTIGPLVPVERQNNALLPNFESLLELAQYREK
jgi:hypothetical protein